MKRCTNCGRWTDSTFRLVLCGDVCDGCLWDEFIFQDEHRLETETKYADPLYRPPQEERE